MNNHRFLEGSYAKRCFAKFLSVTFFAEARFTGIGSQVSTFIKAHYASNDAESKLAVRPVSAVVLHEPPSWDDRARRFIPAVRGSPLPW